MGSETIHPIGGVESTIKDCINDLRCFPFRCREWVERLCLIYGEGPENGQGDEHHNE
jgi:hypothetical protein